MIDDLRFVHFERQTSQEASVRVHKLGARVLNNRKNYTTEDVVHCVDQSLFVGCRLEDEKRRVSESENQNYRRKVRCLLKMGVHLALKLQNHIVALRHSGDLEVWKPFEISEFFRVREQFPNSINEII